MLICPCLYTDKLCIIDARHKNHCREDRCMALVNEHYLKLKAGYLFPEITRRVQAFTDANPEVEIIRLGIGDVTPTPATCGHRFFASGR